MFSDLNKKGNFRYQDKNSNIGVKKVRLLFFNGKLLIFFYFKSADCCFSIKCLVGGDWSVCYQRGLPRLVLVYF